MSFPQGLATAPELVTMSSGGLPMEALIDALRADADLRKSFDGNAWQRFNTHWAQFQVSSS